MNGRAAARRRAIRSMLRERRITSQEQLVELLAEAGHPVTQATVSRDLRAVGAVKSPVGEGRYRLVDGPAGDGELAQALGEFALGMAPSGNLVVIRTPPGAAQVVAGAIDRAGLEGVLGTVAGDDTVLVVAEERRGGRGVAGDLERHAGGRMS